MSWWQDPARAPGKPWTHGQRVKSWAGNIDQIATAADAIHKAHDTSRGVITLLDPVDDEVDNYAVKFPAFLLAHFWVTGGELHGCAYFRKQEMRYWWPINAAELASLQRDLLTALSERGRTFAPGGLMTYTSEAVVGDSPPKVAVPLLDRIAWEDEAPIWRVVFAVFDTSMPDRDEDLAALIRYMWDWAPTEKRPPDGPPVPIDGLKILEAAFATLLERYEIGDAHRLLELVQQMLTRNESYVELVTTQTPQAYGRWRAQSQRAIDEFVEIIDAMRE